MRMLTIRLKADASFSLPKSFGLTAGGGDLLGGLAAELVRLHGQGLGHFTTAEHLHQRRAAADDAGIAQRVHRHRRALLEQLLELIEVHDVVLGAEDVGEAALRHAPVQRHLAAFEAALVLPARARLRALVTASRGLAVARTRTAADALAIELGALGGLEIVQTHDLFTHRDKVPHLENHSARLGRVLQRHRVIDLAQTHALDDLALDLLETDRALDERDRHSLAFS